MTLRVGKIDVKGSEAVEQGLVSPCRNGDASVDAPGRERLLRFDPLILRFHTPATSRDPTDPLSGIKGGGLS
jgi:hypothetical protein